MQSSEAFLSGCLVGETEVIDALKVREAIANLAGVAPESIRAEDRFDVELIKFEFWGSLDSIAVVHELEKCLGIKITDQVAEQIPDPEKTRDLTVGTWVQSVLEVTSTHRV